MEYSFCFPTGTVKYLFNSSLRELGQIAPPDRSILVMDADVHEAYAGLLADYRVLTVPPGEEHKTWETIKTLAQQLVELEAHRKTVLVGIGGGVITDITGFLASSYMRGMKFGFVPTTLLGMVDASVGGKNGVNLGLHKNMLGTFAQPSFILYDTSLLQSLEDTQWSNGFGEIIKYGCICDVRILNLLKTADIRYFRKRPAQLSQLIADCVHIKNKIVGADEKESGIRKILNFGHTAGHAFETLYHLPHGHGVALGMLVAGQLSQGLTGMPAAEYEDLRAVMIRYGLPVSCDFDTGKVMEVLHMDKKRDTGTVDYVLLQRLGKACIKPLPFDTVRQGLEKFRESLAG